MDDESTNRRASLPLSKWREEHKAVDQEPKDQGEIHQEAAKVMF